MDRQKQQKGFPSATGLKLHDHIGIKITAISFGCSVSVVVTGREQPFPLEKIHFISAFTLHTDDNTFVSLSPD